MFKQKLRKQWLIIFMVSVLLCLGLLRLSQLMLNNLIHDKAAQLQQEVVLLGADGKILQAGVAARILRCAAQIERTVPATAGVFRYYVKQNASSWSQHMPPIKPMLGAYLDGHNLTEIEQELEQQTIFKLAPPTRLSQINGQDPKTPIALRRLKRLILEQGVDSFVSEGHNKIHFWYLPASPGKWTLLFSNGRHGTLSSVAEFIVASHQAGYGILIYEYPQNGDSRGPLSQENYCQATRLMMYYLQAQHGILPRQVIGVGYSLGTYMTVRLISEVPLLGAVLIAPPPNIMTVYDDLKKRYDKTLLAQLAPDSTALQSDSRFDTEEFISCLKNKKLLFFYGKSDHFVTPDKTLRLAHRARQNNEVTVIGLPFQNHSTIASSPKSLSVIFSKIQATFSK